MQWVNLNIKLFVINNKYNINFSNKLNQYIFRYDHTNRLAKLFSKVVSGPT